MTSTSQQLVALFRKQHGQRQLAADDVAARERRRLPIQLAQVEANWTRAEANFSPSIARSSSDSWTSGLVHLHTLRKDKYLQQRKDLALQLSNLEILPRIEPLDEQAITAAAQAIDEEIAKYARTLGVKRRQLVIQGEYGNLNATRWLQEVRSFVTNNPRVSGAIDVLKTMDSELGVGKDWMSFAVDLVDNCVLAAAEVTTADPADGLGFERACASLLNRSGWTVTQTQTTGDQGVDLLAEKDGLVAAIQCKNTERPVGNTAVQEVFAGKAFYEATVAVVVSRSGFTASAHQLAMRLSVRLVDPAVLACLEEQLNRGRGPT